LRRKFRNEGEAKTTKRNETLHIARKPATNTLEYENKRSDRFKKNLRGHASRANFVKPSGRRNDMRSRENRSLIVSWKRVIAPKRGETKNGTGQNFSNGRSPRLLWKRERTWLETY